MFAAQGTFLFAHEYAENGNDDDAIISESYWHNSAHKSFWRPRYLVNFKKTWHNNMRQPYVCIKSEKASPRVAPTIFHPAHCEGL